jgi:thiamine-phosphate diphosphorylase
MAIPLTLRVYVVTSSGLRPGRGHAEVAAAALAGGANAVQLRAPGHDDAALEPLARELADRCRERGVLFVVNDRAELAVRVGAAGAHVGQADRPEAARELLGPGLVLGISVDDPEQAAAAERAGADYLAVTVWPTPTKPEAAPRGLDGLRAVAAASALPVVGIGGITAANAGRVLAAGAAGVAVVSAVGAAPDPVAAVRGLVAATRLRAPAPDEEPA